MFLFLVPDLGLQAQALLWHAGLFLWVPRGREEAHVRGAAAARWRANRI